MRKTTTFRSSLVALAAAGFILPAATIQAQETPPSPAGTLQTPAVHVVVRGETLWGLAMRYLGDPYLWPQIYRMNTLVVEDPHWIFPGEELRLEPLEEVEGDPGLIEVEPEVIDEEEARRGELPEDEEVPPPVAPRPPPTETAPTVFLPDRDAGRGLASRRTSDVYRYRSLRPGDFYSAGFLTEDEALPWADVLGNVGTPTLGNLTASSSARIYNEIEVRAPEAAVYQVGDSLLVAQLSRELRNWGRVVVPSGIARVTSVAGSNVRAEVITQFGRISDGQVALPIEHYDDPGDVVPVPIENGMVGEVITARDITPVPSHRDVVFINLGSSDGVSLGDVYEVLRPIGSEETSVTSETEQVALLQIVHVRERSASGLMVNIRDIGTGSGADVRLVRKMPS